MCYSEVTASQEGGDLATLLEAGFQIRTPPLRSSDFELVCSCPFSYYLRIRLGLSRSLSWSAALSRGSWFHKRLEKLYDSDGASAHLDTTLRAREQELAETGLA